MFCHPRAAIASLLALVAFACAAAPFFFLAYLTKFGLALVAAGATCWCMSRCWGFFLLIHIFLGFEGTIFLDALSLPSAVCHHSPLQAKAAKKGTSHSAVQVAPTSFWHQTSFDSSTEFNCVDAFKASQPRPCFLASHPLRDDDATTDERRLDVWQLQKAQSQECLVLRPADPHGKTVLSTPSRRSPRRGPPPDGHIGRSRTMALGWEIKAPDRIREQRRIVAEDVGSFQSAMGLRSTHLRPRLHHPLLDHRDSSRLG